MWVRSSNVEIAGRYCDSDTNSVAANRYETTGPREESKRPNSKGDERKPTDQNEFESMP
jgi:hypothetical protein